MSGTKKSNGEVGGGEGNKHPLDALARMAQGGPGGHVDGKVGAPGAATLMDAIARGPNTGGTGYSQLVPGIVPHGVALGIPGSVAGPGVPGNFGGPATGLLTGGLMPGLPVGILSGNGLLGGSGILSPAGGIGVAGPQPTVTGLPPGPLAALLTDAAMDTAPSSTAHRAAGTTLEPGAQSGVQKPSPHGTTAGQRQGGANGAHVGANEPANILPYPLPLPSQRQQSPSSNTDWALTANPMLDPTYHTPVNLNSRMHDQYDIDKMMEDAPMPGDDSSRETSSNSSTNSSTNSSPMNDENRMGVAVVQPSVSYMPSTPDSMQPLTPGPSDIANLERLNLNPSSPEFDEPGVIQCNRPAPGEVREKIGREAEVPLPPESWCFVQNFGLDAENLEKDVCKHLKEFTSRTPAFTIYERGIEAPTNFKLDFGIHPKTQALKSQFAEGVQLTYDKGCAWLTILTNCTIFVLSPLNNFLMKKPLEEVARYKYEFDAAGNRLDDNPIIIKIFDEQLFNYHLSEAARHPDDERRNAMVRAFCTSTVSVGKGFGKKYEKKIYHTRCFFLLHIVPACNAYDNLLRSRHTEPVITSRS